MSESRAEYSVLYFCCRNGHALGHVVKRGRVRRLVLYARADEMRSNFALLTGPARIWCSVCGMERAWEPGAAALEELLAKRERMRAAESPA